jgi:predicted RNA-binding protein
MCESNAYFQENEKTVLVMKDVSRVDVDGNKIVLIDIMGNKKEVRGIIVKIDFDEHSFYIKKV